MFDGYLNILFLLNLLLMFRQLFTHILITLQDHQKHIQFHSYFFKIGRCSQYKSIISGPGLTWELFDYPPALEETLLNTWKYLV